MDEDVASLARWSDAAYEVVVVAMCYGFRDFSMYVVVVRREKHHGTCRMHRAVSITPKHRSRPRNDA